MDFNYSEEQEMLAASLRRFVDSEYQFESRRRISRDGGGFDRRIWAKLGEIGVLGLSVPVEHGGFGEGAESQLVVHRELGRRLVLEPIIPSSVIACATIKSFGSFRQQGEWLPGLSSGMRVVVPAYLEVATRYRTDAPRAHAARSCDGFVLNGAKSQVWHGEVSDAFLVTCRADESIALFLVPRSSPGLQILGYPTLDGQRGADLHLRNVRIGADALVGMSDSGVAALEHGLDHGIAAQCAAAAGAMERLIEITAEYLCTRKQFGQPLAAFQALQHRLAEMLVQKELALSMAFVAVSALGESNTQARRRMLAAAKIVTARAARFVGQQAVQLHGGIGMADEYEVGDYFKYLTMVDVLLGDSDFHLDRYCAAMAI